MNVSTIDNRRGAVTTEFAVALPVLLLFVFGGVEMARLNILRHAADNAAYEAARLGIVPGATVAEVEQRAHDYLEPIRVDGVTVSVTPDPITEPTVDVTVDVSMPLQGNAWVTPLFTKGKSIQASSTLRAERYRGIQVID